MRWARANHQEVSPSIVLSTLFCVLDKTLSRYCTSMRAHYSDRLLRSIQVCSKPSLQRIDNDSQSSCQQNCRQQAHHQEPWSDCSNKKEKLVNWTCAHSATMIDIFCRVRQKRSRAKVSCCLQCQHALINPITLLACVVQRRTFLIFQGVAVNKENEVLAIIFFAWWANTNTTVLFKAAIVLNAWFFPNIPNNRPNMPILHVEPSG